MLNTDELQPADPTRRHDDVPPYAASILKAACSLPRPSRETAWVQQASRRAKAALQTGTPQRRPNSSCGPPARTSALDRATDHPVDSLVRQVVYSLDGRFLAAATSFSVILLDAGSGQELRRWTRADPISGIAWFEAIPNRSALAVAFGRTVEVLDVLGSAVFSARRFDQPVTRLAAGRRALAAASGHSIYVRPARALDWTPWAILSDATDLAVSSDDRAVAAAVGPAVVQWSVDGHTQKTLAHPANVLSVRFHPSDPQHLLTRTNRSAQVWNLATGAEVSRIAGSENVSTTAFTSDGNGVYVVFESGESVLTSWRRDDLIASACDRLKGYQLRREDLERQMFGEKVADVCPGR